MKRQLSRHFSQAGGQLVTSGLEGRLKKDGGQYFDDITIKTWDVANGTLLQTMQGPERVIRAMLPLPGGKLIAGSFDGTVRLWDVAGSRELRKITLPDCSVETLVLSPDGQYLACGLMSARGEYALWRLSEVFPEAVDNATKQEVVK